MILGFSPILMTFSFAVLIVMLKVENFFFYLVNFLVNVNELSNWVKLKIYASVLLH